jgi:hypothetical protein
LPSADKYLAEALCQDDGKLGASFQIDMLKGKIFAQLCCCNKMQDGFFWCFAPIALFARYNPLILISA